MSELKPCPKCNSARVSTWRIRPGPSIADEYLVNCGQCDYRGPARNDSDAAEEAWNALDRTDYKALAQELATAITVLHELMEGHCGDCEFDGTAVCKACPAGQYRQLIDAAHAKAAGLVVKT